MQRISEENTTILANVPFMEHQYLLRNCLYKKIFMFPIQLGIHLKFYFALDKTNYAFYANVLFNNESKYPNLLKMLKEDGLSVQAQDRYP